MSEIVERVAAALEMAEVGYHLRLTSLVDGVSTYTLSYDDGTADLTFDCTDDAYVHIAHKKRQAAARLAIEALREPTDEMIAAANALDEVSKGVLITPTPGAAWQAMIDAALKEPA